MISSEKEETCELDSRSVMKPHSQLFRVSSGFGKNLMVELPHHITEWSIETAFSIVSETFCSNVKSKRGKVTTCLPKSQFYDTKFYMAKIDVL